MEGDENPSPARSPNSSGISYPLSDEEGDELSDSIGNDLAGSPSCGDSSIRSFEEVEEEEFSSLDQISDDDFILSPLHSSEGGEEEITSPSQRGEEDEDFSGSGSPKRRKSPPEDRISALAEGLLLHIISLLPAESAIRTGVLSKRWMRLWESSPNLIFHFRYARGDLKEYNYSIDAVDNTIARYSSPKVKKFRFHFHNESYGYLGSWHLRNRLDSSIGSWLRFATRRNVEELSLKFNEYHFGIPQNLFNNSSLRKLSSKGCLYEPEGHVSWGSLRKLSIRNSVLDDEALQNILAGSPMLECLKLKDVQLDIIDERIVELDFSSGSLLERLVIEITNIANGGWGKKEIMVSAPPSLKSLEAAGLWRETKLVLLNASSLVNVSLELSCKNYRFGDKDCHEDYVDMFRQLIQQIDHAVQVTLGSFGVQVLSMLEDTISPSPLANYNCKSLILNLEVIRDRELLGIAHLLYHFQTLEKLVINFTPDHDQRTRPSFGPCRKLEDIWRSLGRPFDVLLRHLKTVELVGLVRCDDFFDAFVQFLLQNASVLEKMVICSKHANSSSWYSLAQTLSSIQKASRHAVVFLPTSIEDNRKLSSSVL